MVCPASHTHHLPRIFPESDLVEEACEDIECPLQPLRLDPGEKSIVSIKVHRQVSYQREISLRALFRCRHHRQPVVYDIVHNYAEECGGQGVSLGKSALPIEWESIVSAGPFHHSKPDPVCPEEPERSGSDPVRRDNLEASVSIQEIIRLMEVQ